MRSMLSCPASVVRIWRCRGSGWGICGGRRLPRVGLSATQRPLEEVARYLGGVETGRTKESPSDPTTNESEMLPEPESDSSGVLYRPVTIIDASEPKRLDL